MNTEKNKIETNDNRWIMYIAIISGFFGLLSGLLIISYMLRTSGNFDSLQKIDHYVKSLEEYPAIDNSNWHNPDYTSHYATQKLSFIDKILIAVHIKNAPEWTIKTFESIADQVIQERTSLKLVGECAQAITPRQSDRFFLWTDLQGALHSFVRCLGYLHEHDIITDNLKIKDDCYFIFNGNAFSYGAYVLPMFTLIVQLMLKNPQQVFFVCSHHEQAGGWYDSSLGKALQVFGPAKDDSVVPYASQVDALLGTFPDVLYLLQKDSNLYQAIEIAFLPQAQDDFTRNCREITIFEDNQVVKKVAYGRNESIDGQQLKVRALVAKLETTDRITVQSDGVTPMSMQNDIFKWATFSSPNSRSHQIYQFFYDIILEINTNASIDQWTISEHRNDVRDALSFEFVSKYYLASGLRVGDQERIASLEKQIEETKQEIEKAKRKCLEASSPQVIIEAFE